MAKSFLISLNTSVDFGEERLEELISFIESKREMVLVENKETHCYFVKMKPYRLFKLQDIVTGLAINFPKNQIDGKTMEVDIMMDILFFLVLFFPLYALGVYGLVLFIFPLFSLCYKWVYLQKLRREFNSYIL